jgi:hypothetical protein
MRTHKFSLYFSTRPGPVVEGMDNKSGMVLVKCIKCNFPPGGAQFSYPVQRTGIGKTAIRAINPY